MTLLYIIGFLIIEGLFLWGWKRFCDFQHRGDNMIEEYFQGQAKKEKTPHETSPRVNL